MAAAVPNLPYDMIGEILLRLPPKYLLRCRAVCKTWRGLASGHQLLLAHHRRQPARPLIYYPRHAGMCARFEYIEFRLEALDLRDGGRRSVVRFTEPRGRDPPVDSYGDLAVHGSCGGLLLISFTDSLYLCNPATRRWAPIPPLRTREIAGLYQHGPTGEYRVLYHRGEDLNKAYYILTVGSDERRSIGRPASSASVEAVLRRGPRPACWDPPVLLHGNLHWPPRSEQSSSVLVFDTVAEVFRCMRTPIQPHSVASLFDMDGTLALSCRKHAEHPVFVDLWLLQDYASEEWVHRYSFESEAVENTIRSFGDLPATQAASFIVSRQGDVLVECMERLLHYDMEVNLLAEFRCDCRYVIFTQLLLKESLVPQAFFQSERNGNVAAPRFFLGL